MKPPEVEFANIPNVRMRQLATRFQEIQRQMAKLKEEADGIRERVVEVLGLGRYDTVTVYEVGDAWVKRHHRDGYKAIRARTQLRRIA